MKKFLLSLSALLMSASVFAADITVDFSTATGLPTAESSTPTNVTISGVDFSFTNCKKGSYSGASYLQISGKNYPGANLTAKPNQVCQAIKVRTGSSASTNVTVSVFAGNTEIVTNKKLDAKGADFTFNIPAANQAAGTVYKIQVTNTYNAQIATMTFIEDASSVTPEPEPEVTKVANIAAFLALDKGTKVEFSNPVTAVYQSGKYLFITDSSDAWLQVYGTVGQTYANGDVIPAGIKGTKGDYNGCTQLSDPDATTFKAGTAGTPVEPTPITGDELAVDRVSEYVKIVDVTISAKSGSSFPATDGNADFLVYDRFNINVQPAQGVTVIGFTNVYNKDLQIYPTEITSASGKEYTAAPKFSVAAGEVAEGTGVELTCDTEGAKIYYTLDNSEPTTSSDVYSAPIVINDETTIKAFAVAEGMEPSDVVTATYTVKVVSPNVATYVFTDDAGMKAAYPAFDRNNAEDDGTSGNKMVVVTDQTLNANGVSLVVSLTEGQTSTTGARLYLRKDDQQLRVYNKSTMTFTAPQGNTIEKIVFTFTNGATSAGNIKGQDAWDSATRTWTVSPAASQTEIVVGGTLQIDAIDVTCTKPVTGVENITVADENAPVEYYNLQGVRVVNPENGIYIRRQGNTVTKVLVK